MWFVSNALNQDTNDHMVGLQFERYLLNAGVNTRG